MHRAIGAILAAATIGLTACGGSSNDHTTIEAASAATSPTSASPRTTPGTSGTSAPTTRPAPSTTAAGTRPAPGGGAVQPKLPAGAASSTTTPAGKAPAGKAPATTTPAGPRPAAAPAGKAPVKPAKPAAKPAKPAKPAAPAKPVDPQAAAKAQVVAGFTAGFKAYEQCIIAPEKCDYATASADGSPLRAWLVGNMLEKVKYHLRARPGSGPMTFKVESVQLAAGGKSATLTTCVVDGMVVYDIADPFNPHDDVVFNDRLVATRTTWAMWPTKAGWRRSAAYLVKEWVGKDRCG
jgi:hypothetical protein